MIAEGTLVYVDNKRYQLGKRIGDGKEGYIYQLDNLYVAKIYKNPNTINHEKIKLLIGKSIFKKGLCLPTKLIKDANQNIIGFSLPYAKGREIRSFLAVAGRLPPNWSRIDLLDLALQICDLYHTLHSNGILAGDIHSLNMMLDEKDKQIYLIDLDSCQISNHRCPVAYPGFIPPEILRKYTNTIPWSNIHRTLDNEYYPISVILFNLMTISVNSPYFNYKTSKDEVLNEMFKYPIKQNDSISFAPNVNDPSFYRWKVLPEKLKELFADNFTLNSNLRTINKSRISPLQWKEAFTSYREKLINRTQGYTNEIFLTPQSIENYENSILRTYSQIQTQQKKSTPDKTMSTINHQGILLTFDRVAKLFDEYYSDELKFDNLKREEITKKVALLINQDLLPVLNKEKNKGHDISNYYEMAVKKLNKANSLKQVSQLFLKKDEISKLIQNSYTKLSGEFDYSTRTTIISQIESNLEKLSNVISQLDKLGINVIKQEDYLSNQKDKLINIKEKTEINYKLYQIQNEIEKLLFKTNTDSASSSKCASINQIKLNLKLYSDYSFRLEKLGFKNDYQKRFYENKVFKLDELRKVYRCK